MAAKSLEALSERVLELEGEVRQLRRSADRYRVLLETAAAPICVLDSSGRPEYLNPAFTQTFGWTLEEFSREPVAFVPPSEEANAREALARTARGESVTVETRRCARDGRVRDIRLRAAPFPGPEGRPAGAIVIYRDLTSRNQALRELETHRLHLEALVEERTRTLEQINRRLEVELAERRRAEEELEGQRCLLETLIDAIPAPFFYKDENGIYRGCNRACSEYLGLPREAIVGKSVYDIAPREKADVYHEADAALFRAGGTQVYEAAVVDGKGETRHCVFHKAVFQKPDGTLGGLVGTILDVTERHRVEQALLTEKEKFEVLVEESPLGVSVIGPDGRYKYLNPKFTEMFGYGLSELPTGGEWFSLAYPDPALRREASGAWLLDLRRAEAGQARPRTFTVRAKSGDEKVIHFRPVTMRTGDQLVIYEDVTEQRRLESQLLQSQKMEALGTLASGVAHDFNNLLQAISGFAELVLHELPEDGRSRDYVHRIGNAADRAADLVRSLLAFSRKEKAQPRPLDLNRETAQALRILERTIPKMIEIRTEFAGDLALISADPNQIEQVVMNFATNARDAMPDGGTLRFETRNVRLDDAYCDDHIEATPGEHVLFRVSDTGCGMDASTARRIFEPFFTTKRIGEGTGLGLSTVYGIVKGCGGHIVCSSAPGSGTSFSVYFPALPPVERRTEGARAQAAAAVGGSERILVVDDEAPVRELAEALLTGHGYRVFTACTGEEALAFYRERASEIDLVALDLGMPGMGGKACLEQLRRLNPDVRVLVVSGYSIHSQAKGIRELGAAGFLNKPYRIFELLQAVRQALGGEGASGSS